MVQPITYLFMNPHNAFMSFLKWKQAFSIYHLEFFFNLVHFWMCSFFHIHQHASLTRESFNFFRTSKTSGRNPLVPTTCTTCTTCASDRKTTCFPLIVPFMYLVLFYSQFIFIKSFEIARNFLPLDFPFLFLLFWSDHLISAFDFLIFT
jgi:hypothetical protein